jgi:hypothetical protein
VDVLKELCETIEQAAPGGQFQWNNQVLVHYIPAGHHEPWVTLCTKKLASLELHLQGSKNLVGFGRVTSLAWERDLDSSRSDRDVIKLRFRTVDDLRRGDLDQFLREHLDGVNRGIEAV